MTPPSAVTGGRRWRRPYRTAGAARAAVALAVVLAPSASRAQTAPPEPDVRPAGTAPVLLVLDASGSMNADDGSGRPKIEAAKEALRRLVDEIPDGTPVGLRVYGHRYPNTDPVLGCTDTELIAPVEPLDRQALLSAIEGVSANGFTPIGLALREARSDIGGEGPRTVVLVSDGIDTCAPPEPCGVAAELVADDIELRVETIGFQVDAAAAAQLQCIADVTGGSFREVADAEELLRALRVFEPAGTPVDCAAAASDAPVLGNGQWLDELQVGEQRWCAVELEAGQLLRVAATIVGPPDGPSSSTATFGLEVRSSDILGAQRCGVDEVRRLGQEARQVAVDGLRVSTEGLCTEPGRYHLGLRLADEEAAAESPIAGTPFAVELLVAVADAGIDERPTDVEAPPPRGELPPPPPPPPPTTPVSTFVIAGVVAGALGMAAGWAAARRAGP